MSIPACGCELHFDGVVISGSVIVNESLLTGECVPVTKVSLSFKYLKLMSSYNAHEPELSRLKTSAKFMLGRCAHRRG